MYEGLVCGCDCTPALDIARKMYVAFILSLIDLEAGDKALT